MESKLRVKYYAHARVACENVSTLFPSQVQFCVFQSQHPIHRQKIYPNKYTGVGNVSDIQFFIYTKQPVSEDACVNLILNYLPGFGGTITSF